MFTVRGIAVSLSIFVLLYGVLSVAICAAWQSFWRLAQRCSARRCADLLFALRLAPFTVAIIVTLAFAIPSFLLLEPRAVSEPLGEMPLALTFCGIVIVFAGIWNAAAALVRTSRTIASWSTATSMTASNLIDSETSVSVMRSSEDAPPLTAAGILRPAVWLSGAAEFVLTQPELECALRHELVHVRRQDNLRKLILRMVAFPGMAELEKAWREATEIAADDAAVSSASDALDLAGALIKLSRLTRLGPPAELTTALVSSPAEALNIRVERLIAWTAQSITAQRHSSRYAWWAVAALILTSGVTYSKLLVQVHAATEWLVR